ncbi:MAG: hypothetical protein HY092_02980 [Candidatus Kerfeldbacteria bacterium]|nr:hypothetical protein [Candidatus Kerfeldbacteria bacterium]
MTDDQARCQYCFLSLAGREHFPGCPAVLGTEAADTVWRQAYSYAYWLPLHKDLRKEVYDQRSDTFRLGYSAGKQDAEFEAWEAEERKRENLHRHYPWLR